MLENEHPHHAFHLVGGTDTRDDIVNWFRGEELQQRLPVLVVPRGGYDDDPHALPAISSSLVRQRIADQGPLDDLVPLSVRPDLGQS